MQVVRHDGWALQFASRDLRNDRTVVEAACDQNAESLSFASPDLRGDRSLVLRAVATSGPIATAQAGGAMVLFYCGHSITAR